MYRNAVFYFVSLLLLVLLGTYAAWAETFHVTTTVDGGSGSLRRAIGEACDNGENDTIYLPAGTYFLTGDAGENLNKSGDLDIDTGHGITIIGDGIGKSIIDGNQTDRVLDIFRGQISITGVTLRKGKTPEGEPWSRENGGAAPGEDGGGIYNRGTLILTDCSVVRNMTGTGGECSLCDYAGNGGHGAGIYNIGDLTLTGCTVRKNQCGNGGNSWRGNGGHCYYGDGGSGGGIYNTGTISLSGCTIRQNKAGKGGDDGSDGNWGGNGGDGGGIYNSGTQYLDECSVIENYAGPSGYNEARDRQVRSGYGNGICNVGGRTVMTRCSVTGNMPRNYEIFEVPGGRGGGIYNNGTFEIYDSNIDNNATSHLSNSGGQGGGIYNKKNLILERCTVRDNRNGYAVGIAGCDGGGVYNLGTASISACTIAGNTAGGSNWNDAAGGSGGGAFNGAGAVMTMVNCTVSGNTAGDGSGEAYSSTRDGSDGGDGGGIFNSGTLTLTHGTICGNKTGKEGTVTYGGSNGNPGSGGGLCTRGGTVSLRNTLVANNRTAAGGEGRDCYSAGRGVAVTSGGYNFIEYKGGYTLEGDLTTVITGLDPVLGALANNGGPTPAHALLPGSPALDMGHSFDIHEDQRGFGRPVDIPNIANGGDGADIGAFEYEVAAEIYTVSGRVLYNNTAVAGVTITFSNGAGEAKTDAGGYYRREISGGWSGGATPALAGYTFTPPSRDFAKLAGNLDGQDFIAVPTAEPSIRVSRAHLYFAMDAGGNQTGPQTVILSNSGGGIMDWTVEPDSGWLRVSPVSGRGMAELSVWVAAAGLSPGTYNGAIWVRAPYADNSPMVLHARLKVYENGSTPPPFGGFDSPVGGARVAGSIPVTGWALDEMGIKDIKVFRTEADGRGKIFVGSGVRVDGARTDILYGYPGYPENGKAGWGYMLLTNALPGGGNGTFTLMVEAADIEGNTVSLGRRVIHCDNAHSELPFGTMDTPMPGDVVSGAEFSNVGWALTPRPNGIPRDGSTITVWVDGQPVGNPVYNLHRPDIWELFPDYLNSYYAMGKFILDTTAYGNGVHMIAWSVGDDAGNSAGIGSRYFTILNPGGDVQVSALARGMDFGAAVVEDLPVEGERDFIRVKPLARVEVDLGPGSTICGGYLFLEKSGCYRGLPVGSSLDKKKGIFYWQPGAAFLGDYAMVFVLRGAAGKYYRKELTVRIKP